MAAGWGKRPPGELPVRALPRALLGPHHQCFSVETAAQASSFRNEGQSEGKVDERQG